MKNSGVPIVKEGLPFLLVFLVATLAFVVGGIYSASILCGLIAVYIAYFFRNPERLPPVGWAMVCSPADGKVIHVGEAKESTFSGEKRLKISIFMNLFDVHVNRVPVDGTVKNMKYRRGRFMAANEDRASEENEHNAILLETSEEAGHQPVVLVQVAGLVARRIICYPTIGVFILKGQRMGLIRFGSRCDLYLPLTAKPLVKVGDRVLGGESSIAQLAKVETEGEDSSGS